ncbi:ribulose-1,5-bisphosphate carboxylase/oxygenase large subunit [Candidatus Magnetoovum chiemensis]|nr:ribulose-1,5-bisphosphate carboxylase/oxygenase large subunit [Candidatus Magnetoovum chiemensis]
MYDPLEITYEITCGSEQEIEDIALQIAYEQTIELPVNYGVSKEIEDEITGKVKHITAIANNRYSVIIAYNPSITLFEAPQFLNLLFGNISLKQNIKVVDVKFPQEFLDKVKGPNFGIQGIRDILGIYNRPLLATALKPMGLTAKQFAQKTYELTLGGVDIIKDDHILADHHFCRFDERVELCQEAVERASNKTGKAALYFPNIIGNLNEMERQVQFAVKLGIKGVLISPFLTGIELMRYFKEKYSLIIMAHPAFTGGNFNSPEHGILPEILLGTIMRLFGADISIYPNSGGRFSFTINRCCEINNRLRCELSNIKPAFPAPAGGMTLDDIEQMANYYGPDTVYLIGGALIGLSNNMTKNAEVFLSTIVSHFGETVSQPKTQTILSSCDINSNVMNNNNIGKRIEHLIFNDEFNWQGRRLSKYKASDELEFKHISRQELTGIYGENTSFDLRYFEIDGGGYSSLEKHAHEHVIICLRGEGELLNGENVYTLKPYDIAYVAAMSVHQLRNVKSEPFGFFCIVDHRRDKPIKP